MKLLPPQRICRAILSRLIAALALAGVTWPAMAQVPDALQYTIQAPPPDLQTFGALGSNVAIGGGLVAASVPGDDTGWDGAGVVKIFDASSGALTLIIPNPSPRSDSKDDGFGGSIAMSGAWLAVGVRLEDTPTINAGRVYVYNLAGPTPAVPVWTLNAPTPLLNDYYGTDVALEGMRLIVSGARASTDIGSLDAGTVYVYDLDGATPTVPTFTLNNPSPQFVRSFGAALAISGSRLVVGAPLNASGSSVGNAYVYDLSSAAPTVPVHTLNHPNPSNADYFGSTVSIAGTWVVVGAPYNDTDANDAGIAYVYDLAGPFPADPEFVLHNPQPAVSDRFGSAVSISGTRIAVGAPFQDIGASNAGGVYVYDVASATIPVVVPINPDPGFSDSFGKALVLSGTDLVVGAPNDASVATSAGSAYTYDLASATPAQSVRKLSAPGPAAFTHFAGKIALSGSRLLVRGANDNRGPSRPEVLLYDLAGNTPTEPNLRLNPKYSPYFGTSLSIDGSMAVVGEPLFEEHTGLVRCYDLAGPSPTVPFNIFNPVPFDDVLFGYSVSISGTRVAVGAYGSPGFTTAPGRIDVFDLASPTPDEPIARFYNPLGGGPFGGLVAMSGTRIVAGISPGSNSGMVYLYDLTAAIPDQPVLTLQTPTQSPDDSFGHAVAISGTRFIIGAPTSTSAGSAYVYDLATATPTVPIAILNNPNPTADARFGESVAISGTRIVVGATWDDTGATDAGIAYVYDLSAPTPTAPVAVLRNPQPEASDYFGSSVVTDGETVAISTPYDDGGTTDRGSVSIFSPSPFSFWKHNVLGDDFAPDTGDGDGDGGSNLLEYTLLLDPAASDATSLPQPAVYDYPDGRRLRIFVPRDPAHSDLTVQVQAADSLTGPWTALATSTTGAPFAGPGYVGGDSNTPGVKIVEVRDTVPMSIATQRFMRVKVMH
jgi:WD40 repeat protein